MHLPPRCSDSSDEAESCSRLAADHYLKKLKPSLIYAENCDIYAVHIIFLGMSQTQVHEENLQLEFHTLSLFDDAMH